MGIELPQDTADLLRRSRSGDTEALGELLSRQLPRLRAFVRLRVGDTLRAKESASDIVQSVCADLLRSLEAFEYRSEPEFRSWLYSAVLHKIREHERHHARHKRRADREVNLDAAAALESCYAHLITPSQHAIGREMAERLEAAFDALPEDYREILTLSRVIGLSHAEAAERMGRSVDSVRNLLHRALVRLSDLLARSGSNATE